MPDLFPIVPLIEQIGEVEREIAMRERVYGRQVANKLMTQQVADRRIAVMRAVLTTLQEAQRGSDNG